MMEHHCDLEEFDEKKKTFKQSKAERGGWFNVAVCKDIPPQDLFPTIELKMQIAVLSCLHADVCKMS